VSDQSQPTEQIATALVARGRIAAASLRIMLRISTAKSEHAQVLPPWASKSLQHPRHFDRLSHFCRAHDCVQQIDRQIGDNRPHLMPCTVMQPKGAGVLGTIAFQV